MLVAAAQRTAITGKVIVVLDGAASCETMLGNIQQLASGLNLEVLLTLVIQNGVDLTNAGGDYVYLAPNDVRLTRESIESYLSRQASILRQMGIKASYAVRSGHTTREVLRLAEE